VTLLKLQIDNKELARVFSLNVFLGIKTISASEEHAIADADIKNQDFLPIGLCIS